MVVIIRYVDYNYLCKKLQDSLILWSLVN